MNPKYFTSFVHGDLTEEISSGGGYLNRLGFFL